MKLVKSKSGFTLIELLVVIGILAVLAAIAIPSVAGLIDRANVSADNTNASEMTNAMERFVTEYELYRQDVASGLIKDTNGDGVPDNMDAAQSRVWNVIGTMNRAEIELLETVGFNGVRIDIDSKYAQNKKTAKLVMENYMKTSSSTFEPKQSDMTYWYHIETGYTVVADKNAPAEQLESYLPSQLQDGQISYWIDLATEIEIPDLSILDVLCGTRASQGNYISVFFTVPNPKFYDVDLSKVCFLFNKETDGELIAETATKMINFQAEADAGDNAAVNGSMDAMVRTNAAIFLNKYNGDNDTVFQVRMAFKYEENGITQYVYSPVYATSYNELYNQGKIR